MRSRANTFVAVACLVALVGCQSHNTSSITLATTTSTQDSGLLDVLVPEFRKATGIDVKVVAVGTGQALELGRRGDADVLLVHDPAAEQRFVNEGFGLRRVEVMSNDFVVVGPSDDPAGIQSQSDMTAAFSHIAAKSAKFVSRGDESGTHKKEQEIWGRAEITPTGDWYVRSGQGMGAVLRMANEKRAYTLCDRATFLALKSSVDLSVLSAGDSQAINVYSVIVINPDRHPHVRRELAEKFAKFLRSAEAQSAIGQFGKDKFGQPLFAPSKEGP